MPVSYTHLDVYKRQVQYLTGFLYAPLREEFSHLSFDKPREKSILLSTGGTDPYNMAGRILAYGTPVSYTHLDVYKRQG